MFLFLSYFLQTQNNNSNKMFTEFIAQKFRDRRNSWFSSSSPKTRTRSRGRGSSNGCTVIEYHGVLKLMVLGTSGVGKTTFCSQYVGVDANVNTPASPKLSPKRDKRNCSPIISPKRNVHTSHTKEEQYSSCVFINGDKTDRVKQYDIDMALPKGSYWNGSVDGYKKKILESDGFILVYSKDNRQSYMRLIELVSDIRKLRKSNLPPIVIVGNKMDLNRNSILQMKDSEHVVLGKFPHFSISATENTDDGIQQAFKCLVQMIAQKSILQ